MPKQSSPPAKVTVHNVATVIVAELKRLAGVIQNSDPMWRGNNCIDARGGKIDPQERVGELIIQAVNAGFLCQAPNLVQLVRWAQGRDLRPLRWPFAEGDPLARSFAFPYKRCPRNVFNTVVGERQQIMTVFAPEIEQVNEYYERHPERRMLTRKDPIALTAHERQLQEQAKLASERECKKQGVWPLPPHGLLSDILPSMFPAGDDKSWFDTEQAIDALNRRNDRYARACTALATLIEREQQTSLAAAQSGGGRAKVAGETVKGKTRGPKGLLDSEKHERTQLLSKWDKAKAAGTSRKDFCKDNDVELSDLETAVNWRATDNRRNG